MHSEYEKSNTPHQSAPPARVGPQFDLLKAADEADAPELPAIDIGWIVVDSLDELDQRAVLAARDGVQQRLETLFPEFQWRLFVEVQECSGLQFQGEPVAYLNGALAQRDLRGWDFVIVTFGTSRSSMKKCEQASAANCRENAFAATQGRIVTSAEGTGLEPATPVKGHRISSDVVRRASFSAVLRAGA
ncbi:MAG: hypothetical protein WDZ59_03405 [Pirellulales bacterium]